VISGEKFSVGVIMSFFFPACEFVNEDYVNLSNNLREKEAFTSKDGWTTVVP